MARVISKAAPRQPRKPLRFLVVLCESCLDLGRVKRLRGGVAWPERCPDCAGGEW